MDHDVDVSGAAGIMSREDGFELRDSIGIGLLDAAKPRVVDVGLVRGVSVPAGNYAAVYTGRVAVPHLDVDVSNGLAGIDVDYLVVDYGVDTGLVLDDVLTDILAPDVLVVTLAAAS